MKKCQYCAEEVKQEAIKCKHCCSSLIRSPEQDLKRNTKIVFVTLIKTIVIILISLFLTKVVINEIIFQIEARESQKRAEESQRKLEESLKLRQELEKKQEYDKIIEEKVKEEKQKIFDKYIYNREND